ncbi:Arcn1, partial [Symbiodinium sp. KB8]
GLLVAFSKLIESAGEKQHTYVESEAVRYVYHPLEQLYLVLITTKSSNIVEDLDTIRMLSKLVPEQLGMDAPSEASILAHAFELVFALDEAITADGHKELGDLDDIRTNLAMDSHEEKLANLVKESKQAQAKTEATRREEEMRRKRAEEAKAVADGAPPKPASSGGRYGGVSSGSYGGVSSASMGGRGSGGGSRTPLGSSSGGVSSSSYGGVSSASAAAKRAEGSSGASTQQPSKPRGVGMKLGGGGAKGAGAAGAKAGGMRLGGAGSHLASMMAEEGLSM